MYTVPLSTLVKEGNNTQVLPLNRGKELEKTCWTKQTINQMVHAKRNKIKNQINSKVLFICIFLLLFYVYSLYDSSICFGS